MSYQCKNRGEFAPSVSVQDGWDTTWARRMVDMQFRLNPSCVYSTSELGQKDEQCHGCRWKAGAGTGVAAGPMPVGDSLADLQQGESGPASPDGTGGVCKPSDAAEQRRHLEQTGAAKKLESKYPDAAIYRRAE